MGIKRGQRESGNGKNEGAKWIKRKGIVRRRKTDDDKERAGENSKREMGIKIREKINNKSEREF